MRIVKATVSGIAAGMLLSGCVAGGTSGKPVTVTVTAPAGQTTTVAPAAAAVAPLPSDFAVDITITEQKCFGSAGCNYELDINPQFVGATAPEGKWRVVYRIDGGEDPQTGNFTMDGTRIRWDSTKRASGSAGAVFTAEVTQVLPDY